MSDRNPDELVTLDEIAGRTGVPVKTLYDRKRRGVLPDPSQRSGRFSFWRWGDVDGVAVFGPRVTGRPQGADGAS